MSDNSVDFFGGEEELNHADSILKEVVGGKGRMHRRPTGLEDKDNP